MREPLVLCIFLVLAVSVFLWAINRLAKSVPATPSTNASSGKFAGNKSSRALIDCSQTQIYAVNDSQCQTLCRGSFVHSNGVCVDALLTQQTAEPALQDCVARDGFVAFVTGNTQFGTVSRGGTCLSVDPGVRPDDARRPNAMCRNGQISIDYSEGYPQLGTCKCRPQDFLLTTQNTSVTRAHGTCVPYELMPIAKKSGLLFG